MTTRTKLAIVIFLGCLVVAVYFWSRTTRLHNKEKNEQASTNQISKEEKLFNDVQMVINNTPDKNKNNTTNVVKQIQDDKNSIVQNNVDEGPATLSNTTTSDKKNSSVDKEDASRYYVVQKGDTLSKISVKLFHTSKYWREIYRLNKKVITNPDRLKVGTKIVIPEVEAKAEKQTPGADTKQATGNERTPTGKQTTTPTPMLSNRPEQISKDNIEPKKFITYQIKEGDSLYKISKEIYKTSTKTDLILKYNRDKINDPARLKVGTVIKIPVYSDNQ